MKQPNQYDGGLILKLDPNGDYLWSRYIGNDVSALDATADGSVVFTGKANNGLSFLGKIDGTGQLKFAKYLADVSKDMAIYAISDLKVASDGRIFIAGGAFSYGAPYYDDCSVAVFI